MKILLHIFFYSIFTLFILTNNVLADEIVLKSNDNKLNAQIRCKDPRPQICTMNYLPVCGQRVDGSFKTYSNDCGACSDKNVTGYRDGACDGEK